MVIAVQEGPKRVSNDKSLLDVVTALIFVECPHFRPKTLNPSGSLCCSMLMSKQSTTNQLSGDKEQSLWGLRDRMRATQSVGRSALSGTPSSKPARLQPADSPEVSELENFEAVAAFLISHSSILSHPLLSYIAAFLSLTAADSILDLSSAY